MIYMGAGAKPVEAFRFLEHTADVGFEARGSTLEETFANAALALEALMVDLETVEPRHTIVLEVEAHDLSGLLVNWLSEILYQFDAEGWLFRSFEVRSLAPRGIRAVAQGERFERSRHQIKTLVKAITYYELSLRPTPEGWQACVYVDI